MDPAPPPGDTDGRHPGSKISVARILVGGIETMHMIAKGQTRWPKGIRLSAAQQFYSLVS
jgi:hypothetical protein